MVISLRKTILPAVLITALIVACCPIATKMVSQHIKQSNVLMGGTVHTMAPVEKSTSKSSSDDADSSRFQRPSSQPALDNKYTMAQFDRNRGGNPLSLNNFKAPDDVILAYFGILREAANMADYSGGCGTVGWSTLPYPYAYELLSDSQRKAITLQQFEDSFKGIGQLTLLKLYPAYTPPGTLETVRYHMIEAEVITGAPINDPVSYYSGSHFAYFYGIITTESDQNKGWKIKAIDYFPEDFLCHPMHGWNYNAQSLVQVVYQNWYHLIDTIDKTDQNGNMILVYASGGGKQYRFDFMRITNGTDVLLHEMIDQGGQWTETNLIREQRLKLSILNPNLTEE